MQGTCDCGQGHIWDECPEGFTPHKPKKIDSNIITVDKITEGVSGVIQHWVNQPQYVGNKIFMEGGVLVMTENGIRTKYIDMRYPWYTKIKLDEN